MKRCATLLFIIMVETMFGQTKDRRAPFRHARWLQSLSVSPEGKIWLGSGSMLYYNNNIDSLWHFQNVVSPELDRHHNNYKQLLGVTFFNKDTALITGAIPSGNNKGNELDGYYITKDGGKNWKLRSFSGPAGSTCITTDPDGKAWVGAIGRSIYYTRDYGNNWSTIQLPFQYTSPQCIYMIDSVNGIVGGANSLFVTNDNWKTTGIISTPLDQKKYGAGQEYYERQEAKLTKVQRWKNYWVIEQSKRLFYSDVNMISWKAFPKNIIDVETDPETGKLFALTDSFDIVEFDVPEKSRTIAHLNLKGMASDFIIHMKVASQQLFILAEDNCCDRQYAKIDVYRLKDQRLSQALNYTLDEKIPELKIIKEGKRLKWGTDLEHIYVSDDKGWYMEAAPDFDIVDFKLTDDSTAILWDGIKNTYLYNLRNHSLIINHYTDPLKIFFDHPVKQFSISGTTSFGSTFVNINTMEYLDMLDNTFLGVEDVSQRRIRKMSKDKLTVFSKTITTAQLKAALEDLRLSQDRPLRVSDFKINPDDKREYKKLVRRFFKRSYEVEKGTKRPFFYSMPNILDTLSNQVVEEFFNYQQDLNYRYTSGWFHVTFINTNNDTLFVKHYSNKRISPWSLPWEVDYKKQYFNSSGVVFSRFINTCIPGNFTSKSYFDNAVLMMAMSHYLYNKKGWRLDKKR